MYEGKNFAFICLHMSKTSCFAIDKVAFLMGIYPLFLTKTSCFAIDKVTFLMGIYPLFLTKTSCFGLKIMTTSCEIASNFCK